MVVLARLAESSALRTLGGFQLAHTDTEFHSVSHSCLIRRHEIQNPLDGIPLPESYTLRTIWRTSQCQRSSHWLSIGSYYIHTQTHKKGQRTTTQHRESCDFMTAIPNRTHKISLQNMQIRIIVNVPSQLPMDLPHSRHARRVHLTGFRTAASS